MMDRSGGGERLSRRIPKILRVKREPQMMSHDSNFKNGSPKIDHLSLVQKNLSADAGRVYISVRAFETGRLPAKAYATRGRPVVFREETAVQTAIQPRVQRADVGVPLRG
jgi:hypothetical protein